MLAQDGRNLNWPITAQGEINCSSSCSCVDVESVESKFIEVLTSYAHFFL